MGAALGLAVKALIATIVAAVTSLKGALVLCLLTGLGIVIYNVGVGLFNEAMTWAVEKVNTLTGTLPSVVIQLAGLGAWFAEHLRVSEQVSLCVTAVMTKWMLVKIPFLKW